MALACLFLFLIFLRQVRPSAPRHSQLRPMTSQNTHNNSTLHIVIVTTAAPPWLTGTAVNPALRASYLSFKGHRVTLLVPFLELDEQHHIFAPGVSFSSAEQQQRHVHRFLETRTGRPVVGVDVVCYPGRYDELFCSIIPVGDLTLLVKVWLFDSGIVDSHVCCFTGPGAYTQRNLHVHTQQYIHMRTYTATCTQQHVDSNTHTARHTATRTATRTQQDTHSNSHSSTQAHMRHPPTHLHTASMKPRGRT